MNARTEAAILAKVYRLILSWPDPKETTPSVDFDGETREAGRWVSSVEDDAYLFYHPREKSK
jgi:hypothetical protein